MTVRIFTYIQSLVDAARPRITNESELTAAASAVDRSCAFISNCSKRRFRPAYREDSHFAVLIFCLLYKPIERLFVQMSDLGVLVIE